MDSRTATGGYESSNSEGPNFDDTTKHRTERRTPSRRKRTGSSSLKRAKKPLRGSSKGLLTRNSLTENGGAASRKPSVLHQSKSGNINTGKTTLERDAVMSTDAVTSMSLDKENQDPHAPHEHIANLQAQVHATQTATESPGASRSASDAGEPPRQNKVNHRRGFDSNGISTTDVFDPPYPNERNTVDTYTGFNVNNFPVFPMVSSASAFAERPSWPVLGEADVNTSNASASGSNVCQGFTMLVPRISTFHDCPWPGLWTRNRSLWNRQNATSGSCCGRLSADTRRA